MVHPVDWVFITKLVNLFEVLLEQRKVLGQPLGGALHVNIFSPYNEVFSKEVTELIRSRQVLLNLDQ